MELRSITVETLAAFAQALRAEERCTETIKQYTRSVRQFAAWLAPETVAAGRRAAGRPSCCAGASPLPQLTASWPG